MAPTVTVPRKPRKLVPKLSNNDDVHLIYKIEGKPNQINIFELGRLLDSVGNIISETNLIVKQPDAGDLTIEVKPFRTGSFIMDFVMRIQKNPEYLFIASQMEMTKQIQDALEYLGLIRKLKGKGASLIALLKNLKNGKPTKVQQKGPDLFEYSGTNGSVTAVSMQVHTLYNSGVINNYIFPALGKPLEQQGVKGIKTFLMGAEADTGIELACDDADALRAYAKPETAGSISETLENTTVQMLHPKSGNYGEQSGTWTFRVAGTQRNIKATITHKDFLAQYTSGVIRFYTEDLIKARVHEIQTINGTTEKVVNEIIEVLEYRPGHPSTRPQS